MTKKKYQGKTNTEANAFRHLFRADYMQEI